MPVYATKNDLVYSFGVDEIQRASDDSSDDVVARALLAASRDIESYAAPYGVVPTNVPADTPATAGTFPTWWVEACKEIALSMLSIGGDHQTDEKAARAEYWRKRLAESYPTKINGVPVGGTVTIAGGPREFSADKVVGL